MERQFNPEMLILAREKLGWTQSRLASQVSFTQASISRYESGVIVPPEEHVEELSSCLGCPTSYFYLDERVYAASSMFHRSRASLTIGEERRIHAQVNELRIRAAVLLREAHIESRYQFHRLEIGTGTPEESARRLRQLWQLPPGPVRSVTNSIERASGIVFRCPFKTTKVDGVSQWPLDNDHVPPVFFVNDDIPGDRQRWTLAHEVGHCTMHHMPSDDPESEADRFASEFLMPAREIVGDLSRLDMKKAAALKLQWKTSMASIIRRAYDLGKLTERQYRYFNMELAARGYKRCEPAPIPPEEPELFREVIKVHRRSHGRNVKQLAEMLGMHEPQFREEMWHPAMNLKIAI